MPNEQLSGLEQAFGALRQFTRSRRPSTEPLEHCELCNAGLSHEHPHLVDLTTRSIVCACDPCAILFDNPSAGKKKRGSGAALSSTILRPESTSVSAGACCAWRIWK